MSQYSNCTSLGGDCQVGWQIRQHFNEPIPSPFDWLVTPLPALEAILADKGQRFGRSVSNLPAMPPYAMESTVCDDYGCSYHHDFPHDENGKVVVTPETLADSRSKMLHKWQSFEQAITTFDEVLFIRLGSFKQPPVAWPYLSEQVILPLSRLNSLQRQLASLFTGVHCRLLQVLYTGISPYEADEELNEFVELSHLELLPNLNWQGDEASWAAILKDYQVYDRDYGRDLSPSERHTTSDSAVALRR